MMADEPTDHRDMDALASVPKRQLVELEEKLTRRDAALKDFGKELNKLRRWKAEATEVIERWEEVWEAAGRPGELGSSKPKALLAWVEDLQAAYEGQLDTCQTCNGHGLVSDGAAVPSPEPCPDCEIGRIADDVATPKAILIEDLPVHTQRVEVPSTGERYTLHADDETWSVSDQKHRPFMDSFMKVHRPSLPDVPRAVGAMVFDDSSGIVTADVAGNQLLSMHCLICGATVTTRGGSNDEHLRHIHYHIDREDLDGRI